MTQSAKSQREWRKKNPGAAAAASARWRAKNKDKVKEYGINYRIANKDRYREWRQAWNKRNPDKAQKYAADNRKRNPVGSRERVYKSKYGWTFTQRSTMLAQQNGCCAACKTNNPGTKHGWATHHTGHGKNLKIHGLLCQFCNTAARQGTREDIAKLRSLADKLEQWL
jgi:hypothetical protein